MAKGPRRRHLRSVPKRAPAGRTGPRDRLPCVQEAPCRVLATLLEPWTQPQGTGLDAGCPHARPATCWGTEAAQQPKAMSGAGGAASKPSHEASGEHRPEGVPQEPPGRRRPWGRGNRGTCLPAHTTCPQRLQCPPRDLQQRQPPPSTRLALPRFQWCTSSSEHIQRTLSTAHPISEEGDRR